MQVGFSVSWLTPKQFFNAESLTHCVGSMIICSVACAESIPIIIETLFGTDWVPIVVSTVAIAIFAELLPQYLIPRKAIFWGYYCWPFIWGCMWLTCIISWPLSYLLDKISGSQPDRGIYTLEQLEILIKFHERVEKHGGLLGPDASRVMRGALDLDRRTLRGEYQPSFGKGKAPLADVEKGEAAESDILVPWSSVRCISVNEEVTKELILRIKSWAYSRIPVVGNLKAGGDESADCCGDWNDQKVYGFLHIKVDSILF
jgi:metal transporter CNNM